jgi:hypothetical protein
MKGKVKTSTAPILKFLLKLFSKSLRFPKAEPWSLVATSEILLNGAFLFAKLFLLRLVCQKKKRYGRRIRKAIPFARDSLIL